MEIDLRVKIDTHNVTQNDIHVLEDLQSLIYQLWTDSLKVTSKGD